MKKLITAIVSTVAIAGSTFAQGTVNMGSFVPTYITGQTNTTTYSSLFGGGATGISGATSGNTGLAASGFYYELLWTASGASQPTSLTALGTWTDSGWYAINSASSAGRLAVGNGTTGSAVSGMSTSGTYSTMLVGWSANLGANWTTALATMNSAVSLGNVVGNAFFGMTSVGSVSPTTTTAPGAGIFGASPLINSPNTQLYLIPVPEPSTIALAGLGGLGLLALRRRNK